MPTAHEAAEAVTVAWVEEARGQGVPEAVAGVLATASWDAAEQLDRQLGAELS